MLSFSQVLAFLVTAMVLTFTPGPDNLMVLGIALSKGKRQGMIFGLGCALGCLTHIFMAVIGVSTFINTSPKAFFVLKFAGGAYLIYLGAQIFFNKNYTVIGAPISSDFSSTRRIFIKGLLASSINPKVALFFISFLPQFIFPHQGNVAFQFGFLGLVFIFQAIVIFCLIGYFSGLIGSMFRHNIKMISWLDRISGTFLVLIGIQIWISS
jgi:threonine/homoserine/homoserine lactone efflux protein